jgi:hypothetical protein
MKKIIVSGLILTGLFVTLPSAAFSIFNNEDKELWVEVWRCQTKLESSTCKEVLEVWIDPVRYDGNIPLSLPVTISEEDNDPLGSYLSLWVKGSGNVKYNYWVNIKDCEMHHRGVSYTFTNECGAQEG